MKFTASDILGVGAGFVLFGMFAFAPGYTFGWLSNVFQYRQRKMATRIVAAVPLSIGLMPITAYFLWRLSVQAVWVAFGACGLACAILLIHDAREIGLHLSRTGRWVAAIAASWVAVATLSMVDLQFGNRLYFPFTSIDRATRAAFTAAMARDGIPPHNPFFFAGQPAPLRYHYFWLIPCSLVHALGGPFISARLGLIDGLIWAGLGLLAILALYLRFFQARGGDQIERRTLIAISLLGVAGLDILPVLLIDLAGRGVMPSVAWWNPSCPVPTWITTVFWTPHDLAALVAGLTGFLLTWEAARNQKRAQRAIAVTAAGLSFATSVGASIFVGGTLAVGCFLWLVILLLRRWWRDAFRLASAGTLATVLLLPFILQVTHGMASKAPVPAATKTFPFSLTVRPFSVADNILRPDSPAKSLALNAALLPLNYFLGFGFFLLVACLAVRRIYRFGFRDRAELSAATLGFASLLVCTFLKSTIIDVNDLAWRSPLLLEFVLLLWAAEMWNAGELCLGRAAAGPDDKRTRRLRHLLVATLVLGALGSGYELLAQRFAPVLMDFNVKPRFTWLSPDHQLGQRTFELRQAYGELQRMLPVDAVVQARPHDNVGNLPAQLYSDRQMVADAGNCGTVFGGSATFCDHVILPQLEPLFADQDRITTNEVEETCKEFSISALLVEDTDPVWKDKASWIWKMHPLLSNRFVRVIPCSDESHTVAHLSGHSSAH